MFSDKELGKRLQQAREAHHITQADMSQQVGIAQSKLSRLETGRSTTSLAVAQLFCQHLQISLDDFLASDDVFQQRIMQRQLPSTVYGMDLFSAQPVVVRRTDTTQPHVFSLGMTGSGKSYVAKLELLRWVMAGNPVVVFDVEEEYQMLYNKLQPVVGGQQAAVLTPPMVHQSKGFFTWINVAERRSEASDEPSTQDEQLEMLWEGLQLLAERTDTSPLLVIIEELFPALAQQYGVQNTKKLLQQLTKSGVCLSVNSQTLTEAGERVMQNTQILLYRQDGTTLDLLRRQGIINKMEQDALPKAQPGVALLIHGEGKQWLTVQGCATEDEYRMVTAQLSF